MLCNTTFNSNKYIKNIDNKYLKVQSLAFNEFKSMSSKEQLTEGCVRAISLDSIEVYFGLYSQQIVRWEDVLVFVFRESFVALTLLYNYWYEILYTVYDSITIYQRFNYRSSDTVKRLLMHSIRVMRMRVMPLLFIWFKPLVINTILY